MVKFVILSTQRSGSTFLKELLSSHTQIQSYGEIFQFFGDKYLNHSDPPIHYQLSYKKHLETSIFHRLGHKFWRREVIDGYLNNFYSKHNSDIAVGFKFMYSHAKAYPEVIEWVENNNVRVIHLTRDNFLKTIVSYELAKKQKIYASTKKVESTKVELDPKILKAQLEERKSAFLYHKKLFKKSSSISISYEELVSSMDLILKQLLNFLDLDNSQDLTSDIKKINSDRLSDLINNYDEISTLLEGTEFAYFLDRPNEKS